jgi:YidC/Oxa1 family membrane protein insertase
MFNSDQKRAFIAVLLSGLVLFGWQYYFTSKTPATLNPTPVTNAPVNDKANTSAPAPATLGTATSGSPAQAGTVAPNTLVEYKLSNDKNTFVFNNDLSFTNSTSDISLFDLKNLSGENQTLKIQIVTDYGPTDLFFLATENTPTTFKANNANFGVNFSATMNANGKLDYALTSEKLYKYRFILSAKEKKDDNGHVRQFVTYSKDVSFIPVPKEKEYDGVYKWFGIDYTYHLFTVLFNKAQTAKIVSTDKGVMNFETVTPTKELTGSLVYTKKNYDHLLALSNQGENLHLSVDFGFFAILAVPTLRGLQFIYKYIPNYGLAIVLLTILIRLITFPLQYKSFKSMKKMQQIQPELQKIKEKYKDDNQKMQKETMALFQKAGANPLSGCLPLLLQMPFFFAIYRVLYSAVELVGAPFFGWIHDLSIHDPFYVLPLLMAGSMFLQQKLTPQTSVDPTQQKVMMLMPIIFGFIMKNLPAGLVLYIFVSTMVGIIQQYLVYRSID